MFIDISGESNCSVLLNSDVSYTNIISADHVYGILTCNWLQDFKKIGIPDCFITRCYDDHPNFKITINPVQTGKPNVFYVQPDSDQAAENVLRFVAVCNEIVDFDICIFATNNVISLCRPFCNSQIHFETFETVVPEKKFTCDVIITYGPGALHFIKLGIPVCIAGPNGFGGFVTTGNYKYFFPSAFMGRPGGRHGERISPTMLLDCIGNFDLIKWQSSNTFSLNTIAADNEIMPFSKIPGFVKAKEELYKRFSSNEEKYELVPYQTENFEIIESAGLFFIKRLAIHDTIMILESEKISMLKNIDGIRSFREISLLTCLTDHSFWNLISSFLQHKIIFFK